MPAGRPTKYNPRYCDEIIEAMAEGKSMTAFAAEIGVARSTLNEWMDSHPEFSEVVKKGKARATAWWEERLRMIAQRGGGPGTATATIFGLKNLSPEDWADTQKHDHSSSDGTLPPAVINILPATKVDD